MLRLTIISLFLLALASSCEDPIEIDIPDGPERLVVEGWITDQPGPYEIKLSITNNFNDTAPNPKVLNASVSVMDNRGGVFDFAEQSPGIYLSSPDWEGEIGFTYTSMIILSDGTQVVSSPEPLNIVPEFDSLFYKEVFPPTIIDGIIQEEFFLGSTIQDPPNVDNFYRWRITQNANPLIDIESIIIFSDRFVDGNDFQLEVPQLLFGRLDTIVVQQESISERAFDYYDLLIAQATTLGQSSGTAPAILRGNMTSQSNPEEIVLGYFGAAAIVSDTIIIAPDN
ncbi:MAG: DUF4249 domain-containing protein [Cyclobacteriaceae bacterium]